MSSKPSGSSAGTALYSATSSLKSSQVPFAPTAAAPPEAASPAADDGGASVALPAEPVARGEFARLGSSAAGAVEAALGSGVETEQAVSDAKPTAAASVRRSEGRRVGQEG